MTKRGDLNVNRALETVIEMIGDDDSQNLMPEISKNDLNSVKSVLSKWNENIKVKGRQNMGFMGLYRFFMDLYGFFSGPIRSQYFPH